MTTVVNLGEEKKFGSFAVLDFETSNLPEHRYFKVSITELSIFGIAINEFKSPEEKEAVSPSKLPRVLHKLTLMINPMMAIDPESERISGLNNYMLEDESKFDENAGSMLLSFLKHLQQPVCLVAHNGFKFDFPILKYVLERTGLKMLDEIYALDSLRAFNDIDEIRQASVTHANLSNFGPESSEDTKETFDACSQNETTPKRHRTIIEDSSGKRKRVDEDEDDELDGEPKTPKKPCSRRRLDFGQTTPKSSTHKDFQNPGKKWFPPKGIYKLPKMFKRLFPQNAMEAHQAEEDVKALTQIMLSYGLDFVDYAEQHAIPFSKIPQLGSPNFI